MKSARLCLHTVANDRLVSFDEGRVPKERRSVANRSTLVGLMEGLAGEDRRAYYTVCLTVAGPEGDILYRQECRSKQGVVIEEPRGDNGFGYDPILYVPDMDLTYAEMTAEQKDGISHRGRALAFFVEWATAVWGEDSDE